MKKTFEMDGAEPGSGLFNNKPYPLKCALRTTAGYLILETGQCLTL
jgi:hypothetical protein